jgi:hypothetical protein
VHFCRVTKAMPLLRHVERTFSRIAAGCMHYALQLYSLSSARPSANHSDLISQASANRRLHVGSPAVEALTGAAAYTFPHNKDHHRSTDLAKASDAPRFWLLPEEWPISILNTPCPYSFGTGHHSAGAVLLVAFRLSWHKYAQHCVVYGERRPSVQMPRSSWSRAHK